MSDFVRLSVFVISLILVFSAFLVYQDIALRANTESVSNNNE